MDTSQLTLRINTEGMSEAQKGMDGLANTAGMLESMITKLAAAFAAWRLATFAQEATMLAARYETLGVAMEAVGRNAGYTAQQMAGFQGGLEKTGISMIESRNSLTMLAAAQINLADSSKLARVAQDAAVIGGLNSSEAFGRMIQGIRSGQIETLRTIGINVQFEDGYKKMADQLGKNVKSLTDLEKTQSRANQVIDYGARLAGAYEASMETAGKQIFSMQRYIQDLEVKLGAIFGPALQKMVFDFVDQLKRMSQALDAMQKSGQLLNLMNGLRDSIGSVVGPIVAVVKAMWDMRAVALIIGGAMAAVWVVSHITTWVTAMGTALTAVASYSAATGGMAIASTAATVATNGMNAAITAAGGGIGIMVALIGAAITAWMIFRDKSSDDAKKAGSNIEAETVALEKKIQKQKAYWELIAKGSTTGDASKAMRGTADDDPGVKLLDEKYGVLQSKMAQLLSMSEGLDETTGKKYDLGTDIARVQGELNALLAQRQKFVETFNQAQHGADLVEANQIAAAKAAAAVGGGVGGSVNGGLAHYGGEADGFMYFSLREREVKDIQIGIAGIEDMTAVTTKLEKEYAKMRITVPDTWSIIADVIDQSSGQASDSLVRWMDNLDGVGRSWKTLGDTVRNVIADMLIQMQRAVIQQQLMSPLMNWVSAGITAWAGGSAGSAPNTGPGTGGIGTGMGYPGTLANPAGGGSSTGDVSITINNNSQGATSDVQGGGQAALGLAKMVKGVVQEWAAEQSRHGGVLARS